MKTINQWGWILAWLLVLALSTTGLAIALNPDTKEIESLEAGLSGNYSAIDSRFSSLSTTINKLRDNTIARIDSLQTHEEDITKIQRDLEIIKENVSSLRNDLNNLQLDSSNIQSNRQSIEKISSSLTEVETALETKFSNLREDVVELESELDSLRSYIRGDYTTGIITLDKSWLSKSDVQNWSVSKLLDGNTASNGFHTDSADKGAWVKITFPYTVSLVKWSYYWGAPRGGAIWTIQYSDDNKEWTTVFIGLDCTGSSAGWKTATWDYTGEHKYWRSYKTNAVLRGGYHAELEVKAED